MLGENGEGEDSQEYKEQEGKRASENMLERAYVFMGGTHGPSSSQNLLVFAFWPPALSSLHWEEGPAEGLCLSILGEVLH